MKNILVILDKPKHEQIALQRAVELAKAAGARLHLVSFAYDPRATLPGVHETPDDVVKAMVSARQPWLEELCKQHQLSADTTTEAVWHYSIANWTIETLVKDSFDLVIKTAQKQFGHGGYGSIDWQLIERSSVPLWLAVTTPWLKHERLVAALDPSVDNLLHKELNLRVLTAGDRLAKILGAQLEVVACLPGAGVLEELGLTPRHDTSAEQQRTLREYLEVAIRDSGANCSEVHLVSGKPAREVNRIVDRNKARLMLVGRGVRKGATGLLLGNTAERILSKCNTDVLIVP
ncbi:Nucleotide-binding universal stress protein, UspA family [Microbulbifer donghaiensis]|uniref:Nucleotide-binding universal stress protein, UspA family n=1 Tax=Microbulbifer donghaiensis TaxID=494016 RepID=A0A1M4YQZ2_9GAMM|nr:universal stress protein [Microbulbifer donghaiensis]SHF08098.1 Nucleotide-binding universal stress protein, UspA family [Microbulbifer donghaiensis]